MLINSSLKKKKKVSFFRKQGRLFLPRRRKCIIKVICITWEFKHSLIKPDNILSIEKSTDIIVLPYCLLNWDIMSSNYVSTFSITLGNCNRQQSSKAAQHKTWGSERPAHRTFSMWFILSLFIWFIYSFSFCQISNRSVATQKLLEKKKNGIILAKFYSQAISANEGPNWAGSFVSQVQKQGQEGDGNLTVTIGKRGSAPFHRSWQNFPKQ